MPQQHEDECEELRFPVHFLISIFLIDENFLKSYCILHVHCSQRYYLTIVLFEGGMCLTTLTHTHISMRLSILIDNRRALGS